MFEWREAERKQDVVGLDRAAAGKRRAEPAVAVNAVEPFDEDRQRVDLLARLEPARVLQIQIARQRRGVCGGQLPRAEERFDRVHRLRIEVPVALRTQVHAVGHVRVPEVHRFAHNQVVDAQMPGVCGH